MTTRHFPGRDVGPCGESVREDELVVGRTYFSVHYYDPKMLDTEMEARIFLGRDLFGDAPGFYFQDAASYRAGVSYKGGVTDEADVYCQPPGQVHVMEFERALDRLLYCSLLRAEKAPEP